MNMFVVNIWQTCSYRKFSGEPSANHFLTKMFYGYWFLSRTVSANTFQQF